MENRKGAMSAGINVYGAAAIVLGLIGLVWGDFATNWQRVTPGVPHRLLLAYLGAVYEIVAGAAMLWRRTARAGALALAAFYAIFVLSWLAKALAAPGVYDSWGNVFEELSLVIGGAVAWLALAPGTSQATSAETGQARAALTPKGAALAARLYGVCAVSFGVVHFVYFSGAASFVPKWIPPGGRFWAATTGVCFILAAVAILSGVLSALAARLLTLMILLFEALIWFPLLVRSPHEHFNWAGNGIGIAIGASAWVVADVLSAAGRRRSTAIRV